MAVDSRFIVPGPNGSHWTKANWENWRERTFARVAASVGLAGTVPYDLRHSFASLSLHEGRSGHLCRAPARSQCQAHASTPMAT